MMVLEIIILSEVRWRETNIGYCLNVESKKKKIDANELIYKTEKRHRWRKQTDSMNMSLRKL